MKKQTLKSLIIKLSKENSLITQFTSFVAVEKRVCIVNSPSFYLYLRAKKMILAFAVTGGPCVCEKQQKASYPRRAQGLRDLCMSYLCCYFNVTVEFVHN